MGFTVVEAPQRSAEWFTARLGRLTGSCAGDMLAKVKSGGASASRKNLLLRLVLERLTGRAQEREFVSPAMQDGIDREADAFRAYESLTGEMVQRIGFLRHDSLMAGCSPDGFLGDFDKLLSIKCRQHAAHYEFIRTGKIPADALAQMRHELWITDADAIDYFSWNPDFEPRLQSRVVTVTRAQADVDGYAKEAIAFLVEVDVEVEAMRTLANPGGQMLKAVC
jgi:hypothetical protein